MHAAFKTKFTHPSGDAHKPPAGPFPPAAPSLAASRPPAVWPPAGEAIDRAKVVGVGITCRLLVAKTALHDVLIAIRCYAIRTMLCCHGRPGDTMPCYAAAYMPFDAMPFDAMPSVRCHPIAGCPYMMYYAIRCYAAMVGQAVYTMP